MTSAKNRLLGPIRRRLNAWAKRHQEAEYTGDVPSNDPTIQLFLQLLLWAVLAFLGTQIARSFTPGWVATIVSIPWLLISGVLVRWGFSRYHGLSIPEYSDYLDNRMDRNEEKEDREQARQLERQINSDIQDLKNMGVVESVAVWGDGVDAEIRQRQEGSNDGER